MKKQAGQGKHKTISKENEGETARTQARKGEFRLMVGADLELFSSSSSRFSSSFSWCSLLSLLLLLLPNH